MSGAGIPVRRPSFPRRGDWVRIDSPSATFNGRVGRAVEIDDFGAWVSFVPHREGVRGMLRRLVYDAARRHFIWDELKPVTLIEQIGSLDG